jgi:hypothetical protein
MSVIPSMVLALRCSPLRLVARFPVRLACIFWQFQTLGGAANAGASLSRGQVRPARLAADEFVIGHDQAAPQKYGSDPAAQNAARVHAVACPVAEAVGRQHGFAGRIKDHGVGV